MEVETMLREAGGHRYEPIKNLNSSERTWVRCFCMLLSRKNIKLSRLMLISHTFYRPRRRTNWSRLGLICLMVALIAGLAAIGLMKWMPTTEESSKTAQKKGGNLPQWSWVDSMCIFLFLQSYRRIPVQCDLQHRLHGKRFESISRCHEYQRYWESSTV